MEVPLSSLPAFPEPPGLRAGRIAQASLRSLSPGFADRSALNSSPSAAVLATPLTGRPRGRVLAVPAASADGGEQLQLLGSGFGARGETGNATYISRQGRCRADGRVCGHPRGDRPIPELATRPAQSGLRRTSQHVRARSEPLDGLRGSLQLSSVRDLDAAIHRERGGQGHVPPNRKEAHG